MGPNLYQRLGRVIGTWLPGEDSNPHSLIQSQLSYH